MSCFVVRTVALTFENEARCAAFHQRIREMFIRHSSHTCTCGDTEEITLNTVGEDEVDWHDQLGYVFKGRNEEERLVRIWTMGKEDAKVGLSFRDIQYEPDARTLWISGEQACWGPELFSCFRQYLDGDFGLEQLKVMLWSEYDRIEVWGQNCDGESFYNQLDEDAFHSKREEIAEEQGLEDEYEVDSNEVLEATGVLDDGSDYGAYCEDLDAIDMDTYPAFYDADAEVSADEPVTSAPEASALENEGPENQGDEEPVCAGQRFCEQCGAALDVGSAFCKECGASIDDAQVRLDGEHTYYLPGWMRKASGGK